MHDLPSPIATDMASLRDSHGPEVSTQVGVSQRANGYPSIQSCTNLLLYLLFNIGNPVTDSLPLGIRVLDAIVNAAACRNAGWQPIPISSLVPVAQ